MAIERMIIDVKESNRKYRRFVEECGRRGIIFMHTVEKSPLVSGMYAEYGVRTYLTTESRRSVAFTHASNDEDTEAFEKEKEEMIRREKQRNEKDHVAFLLEVCEYANRKD